jgi:TonB family protein
MKSTITVVLVILLALAGCTVTREVEVPTTQLELIDMTPLPPLESISYPAGMKLTVLLHVMKDGTVENVRILGPSGDGGWDSLAVQSIKQWRYAVPRRDGVPTDIWFRQLVVVQLQEPIEMTIGELASASLHEADSLHASLEKGAIMDTLFMQTLRTVNIMRFPQRIRERLKNLREDDFTRPLRLGEKYVIYKRFGKNVSREVPK